MYYSPFHCYIVPLRPKYPPQKGLRPAYRKLCRQQQGNLLVWRTCCTIYVLLSTKFIYCIILSCSVQLTFMFSINHALNFETFTLINLSLV